MAKSTTTSSPKQEPNCHEIKQRQHFWLEREGSAAFKVNAVKLPATGDEQYLRDLFEAHQKAHPSKRHAGRVPVLEQTQNLGTRPRQAALTQHKRRRRKPAAVKPSLLRLGLITGAVVAVGQRTWPPAAKSPAAKPPTAPGSISKLASTGAQPTPKQQQPSSQTSSMAGPDNADTVEQAVSLFYSTFKQHADVPRSALTIAAAPGRVNLIGEHTDYNDGFVCPLALDKTTVVVGVRAPADEAATSKLASASFPGQVLSFAADDLAQLDKTQPSWGNYPKGVTAEYLKHLNRKEPLGVHAAIVSTVPFGSGLSSSAALEVSFATFLESLFELSGISAIQKALLCQAAEHEYCNVPCGIMDQFISSCGKKDCALLIDCRSKEPTAVAFQDPNVVIVVCNSNVKHELNGGEYKERVLQCQAAVKALQAQHPQMTHLRDATVPELDAVREALGNEVVYRRARHVITEDERTVAAVDFIRARQYAEAGKLMFESHESLHDDYEVSTPELDYLVETARGCEGVFGARMTGGGFGGCIVALVQQQHAQSLMDTLDAGYPADKFGSELPKPASFLTRIGDGAHVVQAGN